jgi:hypothetical protein
LGDIDAYAIADLPNNEAAAAPLAANPSGVVAVKAVVLISPEEVDKAARKTADFRPAGR